MDNKEAMIKRAQALIAARDEVMSWRDKVLREQALAFLDRFLTTDHLALAIAHNLRETTTTPRGGHTA